MIDEAWLFTRDGIPIWSYIINPSGINESLIGTLIGALTLFSTEFTGKEITSVEMEDKMLHIKPFGEIGILVINGDKEDLINTKLLQIIEKMKISIDLLNQSDRIDISLLDDETLKFYLSDLLQELEEFMKGLTEISPKREKQTDSIALKLISKIQSISSRLEKDEIGILILDESQSELGKVPSEKISKIILDRVKAHIIGWMNSKQLSSEFFPEFVFTKELGIRAKMFKGILCVVVMTWKQGGVGNQEDVNKLKGWMTLITKLLS
ncbi:MAG: hypothetical protein D6732_26810 [Methanobacteriota archaeon]|nr:MAG: hypothetical protein D6732_26810 [Euryarchaeota archaeon]